MLILLPPSETKRAGGRARPLDVGALALPLARAAARGRDRRARRAVRRRGRGRARPEAGRHAARRGRRQRRSCAPRRRWPAIDRYTGVLYDALDAASLDPAARRGSARHVAHPLGAVRPGRRPRRDPAYRLGAAASLPGLPPLDAAVGGCRRPARSARGAVVRARPALRGVRGARSGSRRRRRRPTCASSPTATGGAVRALNHFNKHAKGALVRALARSGPGSHPAPGSCAGRMPPAGRPRRRAGRRSCIWPFPDYGG